MNSYRNVIVGGGSSLVKRRTKSREPLTIANNHFQHPPTTFRAHFKTAVAWDTMLKELRILLSSQSTLVNFLT